MNNFIDDNGWLLPNPMGSSTSSSSATSRVDLRGSASIKAPTIVPFNYVMARVNLPLTYPAFERILEKMNADLRLFLSMACPNIKMAETLMPMEIEHLRFEGNSIFIGSSSYVLGIVRVYPNGDIPAFNKTVNDCGGVTHDVDKYGLKENRSRSNDAEELHRLKQQLKSLRKNENRRSWDDSRYNHEIGYCEDKINSYNLLLNNEEPPFEQYAQLSVYSKNGTHTERFPYNRKMDEMMQYLIRRMFHGRGKRQSMKVKNLEVFSLNVTDVDLKMDVENLVVGFCGPEVLSKVEPLIDECSLPLKSLTLKDKCDADNVIFREAESLIFDTGYSYNLPTLSQRRVHVSFFTDRIVYSIIIQWLIYGREVGTIFSFFVTHENNLVEFLTELACLPDAKFVEIPEKKQYRIIINLLNGAELHVYFEKDTKLQHCFVLKLEVC